MKDIKEHIVEYLTVYHYTLNQFNEISDIQISNDGLTANVRYVKDVIDNAGFKYDDIVRTQFNLELEDYKIFKRNYNIDTLLNDPPNEPSEICDNDNIIYLRYLNMLSKKRGNYIESVINYMKTRKIGDPVYWRSNKAVINEINIEEEYATIYIHDTKKVISRVPFFDLKPRIYTKTKPIEDLVPELVNMSTRDLLRLKEDVYGLYRDYNMDDIKDVLNTRENVERKGKNDYTRWNRW
tara:strand:+ start:65462 stop:66175 length:714 start_codon:yes stop_codon:yes gene_type:complete